MIRVPALCLALALAALSTGAAAHASLVSTEPRDGAVVEAAPPHLVLTFNEPVAPLALRLLGPGGRVLKPEAESHGSRLVVALPQDLPRGTHALSWRVASEDGHPIAGSVVFFIGTASEEAGLDAAMPAAGVAPAMVLMRLAIYLGLFVGVGGVFFAAWLTPSGRLPAAAYTIVLACLGVGLLAVPLSLGLQGLDALGQPLSGLADPHAWQAGWATAYGSTALGCAAALTLGLAAIVFAGMPAAPLSLAGVAVLGVAFAASGHASTAAPQWLTRPAVFVHAIGVAFWVGALVPLAALLSSPRTEARAALANFSATIPFALGALVLAGIALAVAQLGTPSALWTTAYGGILLAKLALVAGLLALAVRNRFRLTARVAAGDALAADKMYRAVLAEIVLAALVLGCVALWRFTPPPRSESSAAALREAASLHLHDAGTMVNVTITPGRAGPVLIEVGAFDHVSQALSPKEVTVILTNPAAGIEPIRRAAARAGAGAWTAEATLPVAGEWRVRVDLLVTDFRKVTLEDAVRIR